MGDSSPKPPPVRFCSSCGKAASTLCGRCFDAAFCDEICQRAAWLNHKPLCTPAAKKDATALVVVSARASKKDAPTVLPDESMGVERVVALMMAHPGDARFAERGSEALHLLGTNAANCAVMAASDDAATVLVTALRRHASNLRVCGNSSGAISLLCTLPRGQLAASAAGVVAPLVAVLRTHGADAVSSGNACGALANIYAATGRAAIGLAASGVLGPLASVLRTHASNEAICAAAVAAMYSAMVHPSHRNATAEAASVVPQLVSTLRTHARSRQICEHATKAMCWLSANSSTAAALTGAADAVPVLVVALRAHGSDEFVVVNVTSALLPLVLEREGGITAISAGLIFLLMKALRDHAACADVIIGTSYALAAICVHPEGCAFAAAAVALLVNALRTHAGKARVVSASSDALASICLHPAGAALSAAADALLIDALRTHAGCEMVCFSVCGAIDCILSERRPGGPEEAAVLCSAAAPLTATLRTHIASGRVCRRAANAMRRIALLPACKEALLAAGAAPALLVALEKHGNTASADGRSAHTAVRSALDALGFSNKGVAK